MDCSARPPGDHSGMPTRVPGASRWQLCVQSAQGVSLPLISGPRGFSGRSSQFPNPTGLSIPVSGVSGTVAAGGAAAPRKPTQGECSNATPRVVAWHGI